MCHQLWRCRQTNCTDPYTERRRRELLAQLHRETGFPVQSRNRFAYTVAGATTTATGLIITWRPAS